MSAPLPPGGMVTVHTKVSGYSGRAPTHDDAIENSAVRVASRDVVMAFMLSWPLNGDVRAKTISGVCFSDMLANLYERFSVSISAPLDEGLVQPHTKDGAKTYTWEMTKFGDLVYANVVAQEFAAAARSNSL